MNEITVQPENKSALPVEMHWKPEDIALIKNQICPKISDENFKLFLYQAKRRRLDPLTRQIYAVEYDGKLVTQTAIDGFRLIAERSGRYRGQTPPQWCGKDGVWKDVWIASEYPSAARIGVWVDGNKEPIYAVARWESYVKIKNGKVTSTWDKMPDLMLSKCCEALALRKAFPEDLSGIYTDDEMGQADNARDIGPQNDYELSENQPLPPAKIPQVISPKINSNTRQTFTPSQPGGAIGGSISEVNPKTGQKLASHKQVNWLRAEISKAQISHPEMANYIKTVYSLDSIEGLDWKQFKQLIEIIQKGEFQNAYHQATGHLNNQNFEAETVGADHPPHMDAPPYTDSEMPF